MNRLTIAIGAMAVAVLAGIYSGRPAPATAVNDEPSPLTIAVEDRNPWTSQPLNRGKKSFQFAIVTDRTGGRRPGVFQDAVKKLNLLQPEFVISVGDLIEGYSEDPAQIAFEWTEFQSRVQQLEMPFFYVPGNHDLANPKMQEAWTKKFGRSYYHFRYEDVLFLALNSEDPPKTEPYNFSAEQQKWVKETLEKNRDVRWTFVFLHKPVWMQPQGLEPSGWNAIERMLSDRQYSVFAGHIHRYGYFVRNGRDYTMLATTGGSSQLRGKQTGEIDQFVWVTMKGKEPVVANVVLDGILEKTFRTEALPKPTDKPVD